MRLGDMKRDDSTVPAEVERELDALDAALRGEELPAGMEGLEALVSDLRAERREPDPRFEAELDAWAAAGFPRGKRPGVRASGGGSGATGSGFFARFGAGGSRGWAPVTATVATLVIVAVSISQVGDFGGESDDTPQVQSESTGESAKDGAIADQGEAPSEQETLEDLGGVGGSSAARSERALGNSAGYKDSESFNTFRDQDALVAPESADLAQDGRTALKRGLSEASRTGVNRGQEKRRVDRDAELTLATPAAEVQDVTNQVVDVTEGANGVVLNSRVTGTDESARATLELEVPSSTLDQTLAALSELADVKSRSEQSVDITRSFVSAKDRLVGLRAERDNLAMRIREAATDAEVATLTAQLAAVNRQIADAKNELAQVTNRAQFSTVTVVVTSEGAQSDSGSDDDGWSFGDALGDAGRVLEVVAGVALISAAVLVPLAIIAAIAYIVVSAANRRARERALGE